MKTQLHMSFNYGAWHLSFKKIFDLEFAPFYNLDLMDLNDDYENIIHIKNNDYYRSIIYYDVNKKEFEVDVTELWKRPVRDDVIDDIIEKFKKSEWERTDNTNIDQLKELMNREEKNNNR